MFLVCLSYLEAATILVVVLFVHSKRRGAINQKQLQFLESYKPRGKSCAIM